MILQKTVFILGAGASLDYRFPSGPMLKRLAIESLERGQRLHDLLLRCGQKPGPLSEFRNLLRQSFQPTIDAFVESRREFDEIARLTCAALLLPYEVDGNLEIGPGDNDREDWYSYLFQWLVPRTRLDDLLVNKLAVLTFNFERSFERALYRGLAASFREPQDRLQNIASSLLPTHVHGSLGEPKWILGVGLDYGENAEDPETIKAAAGRLKLVFDDLTREDRRQISSVLADAQQICFLGFGFHSQNLEKLGLDHERYRNTVIRGTVKGMPYGQIEVIRTKRFGQNVLHPKDGTILDMLKWLDYLHE